MKLRSYEQKRDFAETPEPRGGVHDFEDKPVFVIQRHEATALHYDFRIEAAGVLKSWALPKGLPAKSTDKHLAIMTEDHPLEYANFEGFIPLGNYGAGNVEIWDKGTYGIDSVVNQKDIDEKIIQGIDKGKITIILSGQKITGEYTLVKLKNSREKNEWLMIKANKSQISNPKSQKVQMPRNIKPMMASISKEPFDDRNWLFEIKWDGYRVIAYLENGMITLKSRNNMDLTAKFEEIAKSLQDLNGDLILDGEVVVLDDQGLPKFNYIQSYERYHEGHLYYYVFDLIYKDGIDFRKMPLYQRRQELHLIPLPRKVRLSESFPEFGKVFFKQIEQKSLEGIIAKQINSIYEEGARSRNWLKIKTQPEQEAVIGGFNYPSSGRTGFSSLMLGVYDSKGLRYIGSVGTGFDDRFLRDFRSMLDKIRILASPFYNRTGKNGLMYVEPKYVCQIKFREWTEEGLLRQPVFLGLREDKDPKEVIKED